MLRGRGDRQRRQGGQVIVLTQVCTLKYFANAQLVSSHGSTQVDQ